MGNKEKQYTSFRYSSLILYAQKAYLNNINVVFFLKANPIVAHILTPASLNTWSLKAARESRKIVVGCVPGKFPMF